MQMNRTQIFAGQLMLLFLASYVLPLQAYLTQQPVAGSNNFVQYAPMYLSPLDIDAANAPFVFRQFGAVLVHLVYKAGIFIDLEIRYQASEEVRRVFFAAIIVNWAGLLLACALVTDFVNRNTNFRRPATGLLAGVLVLLSYGVPTYAVTGLMDAWTWTFVAALYCSMSAGRERLFHALLLLSVTQREITPLIFAVWSLADLVRVRKDRIVFRRTLRRGVAGLAVFAGYLLLRLVVFPDVPGNPSQLWVGSWLQRLGNSGIGPLFLFKVAVQQNILILFVLLVCATFWKAGRGGLNPLVRAGGGPLAAVALFLFYLGLGAGIWLNTARLLLFLTPVIAAYSALLIGDFPAGEGDAPQR